MILVQRNGNYSGEQTEDSSGLVQRPLRVIESAFNLTFLFPEGIISITNKWELEVVRFVAIKFPGN